MKLLPWIFPQKSWSSYNHHQTTNYITTLPRLPTSPILPRKPRPKNIVHSKFLITILPSLHYQLHYHIAPGLATTEFLDCGCKVVWDTLSRLQTLKNVKSFQPSCLSRFYASWMFIFVLQNIMNPLLQFVSPNSGGDDTSWIICRRRSSWCRTSHLCLWLTPLIAGSEEHFSLSQIRTFVVWRPCTLCV